MKVSWWKLLRIKAKFVNLKTIGNNALIYFINQPVLYVVMG